MSTKEGEPVGDPFALPNDRWDQVRGRLLALPTGPPSSEAPIEGRGGIWLRGTGPVQVSELEAARRRRLLLDVLLRLMRQAADLPGEDSHGRAA